MTCKNVSFRKVVIAVLFLAAICLAVFTSPAQEAPVRKALFNPPASYPEVARRLRLSGTVKVQVVISPEGKITDVKLIGGHPLFVNSVQEILKSWKYAPATTDTKTILEFNFQP